MCLSFFANAEIETEKNGAKFPLLRFGGDMRDRTADLLNAIQALSQLSYTPKLSAAADDLISIAHLDELVNSIL